jgi:dynein heavy chain
VFGLHANAEIGFLTNQSNDLMSTCLEFAPMTGGGGGGGGGGGDGGATMSEDDKTREYLQGMMEKTGELKFDMIEMNGRVDEDQKSGVLGPYVCDCLQECGRMEKLLGLMRASFTELDKGLKGELSMNPRMEALVVCFQLDQQFDGWSKFNYISQKGLAQWTFDLQSRCKQLDAWQAEMVVPKVMWVPGTFNPQAFINAVIQSTARKNVLPLDKMTTNTDVLKKFADEIAAAPRDGSYITGLFIEGGRWDMGANCLKDQELKKMNPLMPVIYLKPITVDKKDLKDMYECPVYITQARGSQPPAGTFVFAATLKTKDRPSMWIKAGVAMILSLR